MKAKKYEASQPVPEAAPPVKEPPKPSTAALLLQAAEVHLRAITETPLLHGLPLFNEAEELLAEVRAARKEHKAWPPKD
jgi:hypothetical protein